MPPKKATKTVEFGMKAEVKTLYYNPNTNGYTEKEPKQLKEATAKTFDNVAIRVYKKAKLHGVVVDGFEQMEIIMIELQSPILVKALKDMLAAENIFLQEGTATTLNAPFRELYFNRDEIQALFDKEKNNTALKVHLELLVDIMDEIFGEDEDRLNTLRDAGLISHDLAWTLFPRGCALFCGDHDATRILQVIDIDGNNGSVGT